MATLLNPFLRADDANGNSVSGGQLAVFQASTTTPVTTYSDRALTTAQAQPLIANAAGEFAQSFVASGIYKIRVSDADGVTLYENDNVRIADRPDEIPAVGTRQDVIDGSEDYSDGTIIFAFEENEYYEAAPSGATAFDFTNSVGEKFKFKNKTYVDYDEISGSAESARGVGSIWVAGPFHYIEVSSGEHFTNAASVKLKALDDGGEVSAKALGATGDGTTDDTAAIQRAVNAVQGTQNALYFPSGTYLHRTITISGSISIRGAGRNKTQFLAKSNIGQNNMFYASGVDGISFADCGFNMQNDAISGVRTDAYLENIICLVSCKNVFIERNRFQKAINYTIILNAASGAESENFYVRDNVFEGGARGGFFSSRYGRNIHVTGNRMNNVCNETFSGIDFDKSISVSGCIGCWIEDNYVSQDVSGGGTIIVEYQDRQSEDVVISGNRVEGASENSFKVGASVGVKAFGNSSINCGAIGFYIEGCYDFDLHNNFFDGSDANAVRFYEDATPTTRQNRNIRITENTFKNSNTGGHTLGTPNGSAGDDESYHIACRQSLDVYIRGNYFIDDGASTAGGIWMQATDRYWIEGNDLLQTKSGIVTLYNTATTGNSYRIADNSGMRTKDEGVATIPSGSALATVTPDVVSEGTNSLINVSLKKAFNGNAAYIFAANYITGQFRIYARNASHTNATTTADIDVVWSYSVEDCIGVFGKTTG